ncbi:MAG TPA: hypothetical protein VHY80_05560 [Stellaceae bacterium]|jgi:uncharacterized lipoprotein YmbA|nr:hypothetical protein [Stellaceae bacterium]
MRFPLIVVSLLALAACQPLPHPFEDTGPPPNSPLITPPDSAGIVVLPVAGAPGTTAHDLADAMATALQDNDVPAGTEARNRGSYVLQGKATPKGMPDGKMQVTIVWAMNGPDGKAVGQQEINATMTASAWQDGGAGITNLVDPAAPALAKLIQSNIPMPVNAGSDPLIAVHLGKGAPGDGGQALATAMSAALRRAQVSLADFPGAVPNYIVEVTVGVTPPAAGQQKVSIDWTLHNPDGSQIGQVKQENNVEAGSLDKVWGLTAYDAANAAAPGITALIDEAKRGAPHAS